MGVCASHQQNAEQFMISGEAALEKRNLLEAKSKFGKAIAEFPVAHMLQGTVLDTRRSTRHFLVTPLTPESRSRSSPSTSIRANANTNPAVSSTSSSLIGGNPLASVGPSDSGNHNDVTISVTASSQSNFEKDDAGPSNPLKKKLSEPSGGGSHNMSLFDPADKETIENVTNLLEARLRIGSAYMKGGYWTLAEEQYLLVNQLSGPLQRHVDSFLSAQRIKNMSEDSSIGLAKIALAEAKACNGVQPTFGHMCRLASFHAERTKNSILEFGEMKCNARLVELLLVEKQLHQIQEEHQSALASLQRCLGIVTACRGVKCEMREGLLAELKVLKIRAAQEAAAPSDDKHEDNVFGGDMAA